MSRRITLLAASLIVAFAAFISCTELLLPPFGMGGEGIRFKLFFEGTVATKSAPVTRFESVDLSRDGISLFVTPSVEVNGMPASIAEGGTKGAIVDKESLIEATGEDGIPLYMLTTGSDPADIDLKSGWLRKEDKTDGEEYWTFYDKDRKKIDWVEADEIPGGKVSFLSYYDKAGTKVVKNVDFSKLEFTYDGIASNFTLGESDDDKATDAQTMEDLIIAYASGIDHQNDHGSGSEVYTVDLHYYHPLAAVRFVLPVKEDRDKSVTISRVTINNVKTGGKIVYNKDTDNSSKTAFKTAFVWTASDERDDYAQIFTDNKDNMTFFIVPQALDDVVVTFNVIHDLGNGVKHEHQMSAPMSKLGTTSWDQGYIYTYTLDTKALGEVDIEISETFSADSTVKKNVIIDNTVQSTAFIRARIFANWCTESGKIICSYPLTDSNIDINTTNWLLGEDGFYYCNLPVHGYASTPPLIKEFTMPSDLSSVDYAKRNQVEKLHLEMKILAQAVESDTFDPGNGGTAYIVQYWGDSNGRILLKDGRDLISVLKF